MVKLELTKEQAELLSYVIDGAQFNSTVAQADETFAAVQMLKDIKARLLIQPEKPEEAEEEEDGS
jgi:hypothetical protein